MTIDIKRHKTFTTKIAKVTAMSRQTQNKQNVDFKKITYL